MNYLLNKDLSLEAKGLLSLIHHLQKGSIYVNIETIMHYTKITPEEYHNVVSELIAMGYADYDPLLDSLTFVHDSDDLAEAMMKRYLGDKYEEYKNK